MSYGVITKQQLNCTRVKGYAIYPRADNRGVLSCYCRHLRVERHEEHPNRETQRASQSSKQPQTFFFVFFALMVIPGSPLFSLTIRLRNPFPCPGTFVTGQRLLKQSFPDSASRLCTVGSATRPSSPTIIIHYAVWVTAP